MDIIFQFIGGLVLAFLCWYVILFIQAYPRCAREYQAQHQRVEPPKLLLIDGLSHETVGTLNGEPIWASVYSGDLKYDFDGVIEPAVFAIIGTTNQILVGNLVYKLSES